MSGGVEFRPEAEREIEAAFAWYEEQRTGLGLRFVDALHAATRTISELPEGAPRIGRRTRRVPLHRFPWFVLYVVEADCVLVTACFHTSRSPEAWQDRVCECLPVYLSRSHRRAA